MNLWERFSHLRMRCRIAETQAGQGQLDVANGRNADVLRLRLEGIREELYAAREVVDQVLSDISNNGETNHD